MYNLEKVIRGLECCVLRDPDDKQQCDDCPYRHPDGVITNAPCVNGLMGNALSLLKAQEPVHVKYLKMDHGKWLVHVCGNCGGQIREDWKCCPVCSKAVKWDE